MVCELYDSQGSYLYHETYGKLELQLIWNKLGKILESYLGIAWLVFSCNRMEEFICLLWSIIKKWQLSRIKLPSCILLRYITTESILPKMNLIPSQLLAWSQEIVHAIDASILHNFPYYVQTIAQK
jgi:hypothetical protein